MMPSPRDVKTAVKPHFEWSIFDLESRGEASAFSQHPLPRPDSRISLLADKVAHVIGICDQATLVFLDRSLWVCSVDLPRQRRHDSGSQGYQIGGEYQRHLFVPYDWFAGRRVVVSALVSRDVLFARGGDLMIVRGGCE